jgi:hypothetical protein
MIGRITWGLVIVNFCARSILAFGPEGHGLIGAIADQRLAGKPVAIKLDALCQAACPAARRRVSSLPTAIFPDRQKVD